MANPHHHDEDPTKQPHQPERKPESPPAGVPDMSLDKAHDELMFAEPIEEFEVVEADEVPMVEEVPDEPGEEAPPSEVVEAIEIVEDDLFVEEEAEVVPATPISKPDSDVYLADAMDDGGAGHATKPTSEIVELDDAAEVFLEEDAVLTNEVVGAQPMDSPVVQAPAPVSGVPTQTEALAPREPGVDLAAPFAAEKTEFVRDPESAGLSTGAAFPHEKAELPATEIAPQSWEAMLSSGVNPQAEAAPFTFGGISESAGSVDLSPTFGEPIPVAPSEHHTPHNADVPVETPPASDVVAAEWFQDEAAPANSGVKVTDEVVVSALPPSGVEAEDVIFDDVEEIGPDSVVSAVEEVEELEAAEDAPESALEAEAEEVSSVEDDGVIWDEDLVEEASAVEAASAAEAVSAVEAEEVLDDDEIAEAEAVSVIEDADEVLEDEDIVEAAPASSLSAVSAVELADDEGEPSSATRKAESVFDDEVLELGADSAVAPPESDVVADFLEDAPVKPKSGAKAKKGGARTRPDSEVSFDEPDVTSRKKRPKSPSSARRADQTIAFDAPPSSAAKTAPSDSIVIEDDFHPTSEASAVNLGDMPTRKGSSISGIDPVAEALESGVGIEGGGHKSSKDSPSVEFDELLDDLGSPSDLGGSSEIDVDTGEAKKGSLEGTTEMDAGGLSELDDEPSPPKSKKKNGKKEKKPVAETGDDVNLEELFDEGEVAKNKKDHAEDAIPFDEDEPADAEEVAEVALESDDAVSFDDEIAEAEPFDSKSAGDEEAAEADEDAPWAPKGAASSKSKSAIKKGKKPVLEEDEEETLAEEDEVPAPKKKGKKVQPVVPPAPAQPSMALRWLGGMFVATLLLLGGGAAAFYFAPYKLIKDSAEQLAEVHPQYEKPKPPEKTKLEKARLEMDRGNFQAAEGVLQNPLASPAELSTRGEARWLAYFKEQSDKKVPLNRNDPKVKEALKDLADAKNEVFIAQIENTLKTRDLDEQVTKITANEEQFKKDLETVKADKEKSDTLLKEVKQALVEGKIAAKVEAIDVATLPKTLKELGAQKAALDDVNKLLKDNEIKAEGDKGVKEVLDSRKEAEDKLATVSKTRDAVNKVLEGEKTKGKDSEGVQELVDARNKVAKDRDDLSSAIGTAFKELADAKLVPADGDPRKQVVEGVKLARQKAESPLAIPLTQLGRSLAGVATVTTTVVEKSFDMAKVLAELGYYKTREPFIESPQQKMDTYITLLQNRTQNDPKQLAAIQREADWILSEPSGADAEARAKARYVHGLVLRNQEKFAEAKVAFDEMMKIGKMPGKVGPWNTFAKKSQLELSNPSSYYLPRIEKLASEGNWKSALNEVNEALKAMPGQPSLLAERAQIRLELARGQGAKIPAETQKAIRDDAQAAGKADAKLAPRSAYLEGHLEEELGNLKNAERLYREALKQARKAQPEPREEVGTYLNALGNLLLRDRTQDVPDAAPAEDDKKKKADKVGMAAPGPEQTTVLHPWSTLVVGATLALQPDDNIDNPKNDPKLKEVVELAKELIASDKRELKGRGYIMLGQAYSKQGDRTEGLRMFSMGMELLFPGMQTSELTKLIQEHPAFQQPDLAAVTNPEMAGRFFGEGLHHYWAGHFAEAEAQFKQAVRYEGQDARFQYFLGLSQLGQNSKVKRDAAIYSFEQGARLEARGFPTVDRINLSLERIQGNLRQYLNNYRYKAFVAAPEGN